MSKHGPDAAIAEVNKVRSGGVGGFFCREEFEIIVDPRARSARPPTIHSRHRTGGRSVGPTETSVADASPDDIDDARLRSALLRRLDETAETEVSMARRERNRSRALRRAKPAIDLVDDPIDLIMLPPSDPTTNDDAGPVTTDSPTPPALAPVADEEVGSEPQPDRGDETDPLEITPAGEDVPAEETEPGADEEPERDTAPGFWSRLVSVKDELHAFASRRAGLTVVVGPLASTMPVVRMLQCQDRLDPDDVVVLTTRAEIVSEPSWNLVRQDRSLIEAAAQSGDRSKLLVIDVPAELPIWVAPLIDRLRSVGIDLVRFVVPGSPVPDDLLGFWAGPENPYVIDLVSRLAPERVVRLVKHGHPVATIAGVDLSAALLLAMGGVNHGQ
ncbi:MAG: hypothetical protein GY773_18550 [Actinomycetia bacterium]|nr:hypothetical protein [Actinomycetes bacterium]